MAVHFIARRIVYLAPCMRLKKILRYFFFGCLAIIAALALFLVFSLAPVNRTPVQELGSYDMMMDRLADLDSINISRADGFSVGFAKVNLTPDHRTATAGYANRRRKLFTEVLDSIYVRALVLENGSNKVAIVSADLLIIPPAVTEILDDKLNAIGFSLNNTYLGATHTHNSIGNWGGGAAGFIYGGYDESIVDFIASKIVESVRQASLNLQPAKLKAGLIPVPQAVDNRLISGGPRDSLFRVMEIHRNDSSKLLLMSFTAHATCLFSRDLALSADYPGKLINVLEKDHYDFAMFMAGSVGSHRCGAPMFGRECIDWMATEISESFLARRHTLQNVSDSAMLMLRVPLLLSDPQVKLTPGWKVRSWLFRSALGEYPVYLTGLRIGNVVMLGAPCDFSGEFNPSLDSLAFKNGLMPMVTSFNGGYIGYVTPFNRYDIDHHETQLMNWYAPGTGEYIEESFEKIILVLAR
jgi:hypothetical protein